MSLTLVALHIHKSLTTSMSWKWQHKQTSYIFRILFFLAKYFLSFCFQAYIPDLATIH